MKKKFVFPVIFALFAACSSPLLEWIETAPISETVPYTTLSDKAITAFSFGIPGETVTIRANPSGMSGKTPITVILPAGWDKSNLTPYIEFIGKYISPRSGMPQNFNVPVTYQVVADDDSWREYV
jgi:hypothetical protein